MYSLVECSYLGGGLGPEQQDCTVEYCVDEGEAVEG